MKKYTQEELKYFMEYPGQVLRVAEEHNLVTMWTDFLCESPGMTIGEIVKDFFYHYDLMEGDEEE